MEVQQWAQLILSLLGGGVGLKLIEYLTPRVTGRAQRRRSEVDRAWQRADHEARKRRRIEEHASRLRRIITEAPCLTPADLPPYPSDEPEPSGPIPLPKEKNE